MSYSIQNIIYGIPLTQKINEFISDDESEESTELEDHGFESLYTSSGDYAGYCGVTLAVLDECADYRPISEFNVKPTAKQKATAMKLVKALDPKIRKLAPKVGIYIVYSSS